MKATLDHIEDTAANIKTFWFKPASPVRYEAGQFTELYLPHENPDDRGIKRWFTISSSPTDPLISITTKFATDRSSTFNQTLLQLKPGTELMFADPMGDFVLPKDKTLPLLFVAGGIGVTPIHSMIKYLSDTREQRDIQLLYAAHHDNELAFKELFENYKLRDLSYVIHRPSPAWKGEVGSLTPERILQAIHGSPDMIIYLSGPEPMVELFDKELKAAGINKHRLVTDFFPGYQPF
jgi:ferredoxin-NADP reductase